MEFVQVVHDEERAALQAEIANEQLQRHGMDQERQRAGQQFEPNEQFQNQISSSSFQNNSNGFNNPLAGASFGNVDGQNEANNGSNGLRDSVILVDHQDVSENNDRGARDEMVDENSNF
jgi:hypothetical protein|tara:strand:- start:1062 stop:1418 length:357 start_codon:yes stop_codon:yes gene_type:complete